MEEEESTSKVYVGVEVEFSPDGIMYPRALVWEDGIKYNIDRVVDMRPAASLKAGGQGDRYTVVIKGQRRYLFFEKSTEALRKQAGRWFVERERLT